MGVVRAQTITEDRAPGGQVIDGSLRFDDNYLTRTPSSEGNLKSWTWSAWVKPDRVSGNLQQLFEAKSDGVNYDSIYFTSGQALEYELYRSSQQAVKITNRVFRDTGWYHLVVVYDAQNSTADDRVRIYVNGERETSFSSSTNPDTTDNSFVNDNSIVHQIGDGQASNQEYDGRLSQVYLVDGQALDASYFGFTDPLTNTWRPKKYTGTYGTNGFYLPLDGNSPIGEDKSGNGNNFTPAGFGGSNSIEKATGALPILNTTNGGRVATVGVRTDTAPGNGPVGVSTHLVLALPLVSNANDVSNQVNGGSTTKTLTENGSPVYSSAASNFYGRSIKFDASNDYLTLPASSDYAFGNANFTVEWWENIVSLPSNFAPIIHIGELGSTGNFSADFGIRYESTTVIRIGFKTNEKYVDFTVSSTPFNVWRHCAVVREGNQLKLYRNGILEDTVSFTETIGTPANNGIIGAFYAGGGGGSLFYGNFYMQDLRVYKGVAKYTSNFIPASTDPDILPDTPSGVAGGSALTKITDGAVAFDGSGDYLSLASTSDFGFGTGDFTVECFVYSNDTSLSFDYIFDFRTNGNASEARMALYPTGAGGTLDLYVSGGNLISAGSFRISAWNHVAVVRNSGTTTLYLNGISIGSASDSTNYADAPLQIGQRQGYAAQSWNGFISNFRVIKGTALYTSNFTPPTSALTNVTNTKLLCCHSNVSADAAIVSPGSITTNGNVTATNFNPFTTDINAVRGQESGWCTLNPLDTDPARTSTVALSNGNLDASVSTYGTVQYVMRAATFPSNGKDYFEVTKGDNVNKRVYVGFLEAGGVRSGAGSGGIPYDFYGYGSGDTASANTAFVVRDGTAPTTGLPTLDPGTSGDVLMVAHDRENKKIWFGKNGIWFTVGGTAGNPATGTAPTLTYTTDAELLPCIGAGSFASTTIRKLNFGQKPFKYSPPEGFKTLCLANLPRPTEAAVRPDKYFATTLWTGDNTSNRTITTGLQSDFIWIKRRDSAVGHLLFDSVRGAGKTLRSQSTGAESDDGSYYVQQFNSDNFLLGTSDSASNATGGTYVSWTWKAGGNSNTYNIDGIGYATASAAGLDGGSVNPTSASVGTEQGFSIIKWNPTPATVHTVSHGLGKIPKFMIFKQTNASSAWSIYHEAIGATNRLTFTTDASTSDTVFGNTAPTDTVFTNNLTSGSNEGIAYLWAEIPGFSKFGSYTGNNNADGPFVHCGFKPAWVMIKNADAASTEWYILDNKRDPDNPVGEYLSASSNAAESTYIFYDFLSNGFKLRNTGSAQNPSSQTIIFAAFAEAPTNNLFGGQANAR